MELPRLSDNLEPARRPTVETDEVVDTIETALFYVPSQARRYLGRGLSLDELIAAGNLGLVEAAIRFDASRNVRFTTYANWWIRKAILEALGHQSGPMRLPRYQYDRLRTLRECRARWRTRHGREPTRDEVLAETGIPTEDIDRLMTLGVSSVSLEQPMGPNDERTVIETLEDTGAEDPDRALVQRDLARRLRSRIAELATRERQVLSLRFGLADGITQTLRETARQLGISRERVRQVELRALVKLRDLI